MAAVLNHWTFRDFLFIYIFSISIWAQRGIIYTFKETPLAQPYHHMSFLNIHAVATRNMSWESLWKLTVTFFPNHALCKSMNCITVRINNFTTNHELVDSIMRVIFQKLYHWSDLEWRSIINMLVNPTLTISLGITTTIIRQSCISPILGMAR